MKPTRACICALLCMFLLGTSRLAGQSITLLDTVYTPPGYAEGQLLASIYIPARPNGVGVVLTHGIYATRKQMQVWCDSLARNGYVAMAIDYYDIVDTTHGGYPKPVRAFKTAVQFLRRNAARFGILPARRIGGIGLSQGSIVWGQTVIWDNDYAFFLTDSTTSDHLDALVTLYGLFDTENFLNSSQPLQSWLTTYFIRSPGLRSTKGDCIANERNITTPMLLVHGTADPVLQYQQSVQLYDSIRVRGGSADLLLFSGQGHEFDLNGSETAFTSAGLVVKDSVLAFFNRTLVTSPVSFVSTQPGLGAPTQFVLYDNYPNPFNPTTIIEYSLPHASNVRLSVYDVLGRSVAVLVDQNEPGGRYKVTFSASGLSSGVYFYRLQVDRTTLVKRMMLLR